MARLAALGHEVLCAPVIEIVPTGAALPSENFDAVLATSAQAIQLLDAKLARTIQDLPLFVVGEKTAGAARKARFTDLHPAAPDARHLAETIAASYAHPAKFLYLAGRDRKPHLEAVLGGAGHRIDVVIVYEARAASALPQEADNSLRGGEIDAILHYSRRSATIFRRLIEAAGLADPAGRALNVCISADAAAPLQGWASRLAVADEPNEAGMLGELDATDDGARAPEA